MKHTKFISSPSLARLLALAILTFALRAAAFELNIGVQTWTLRNLNFDQMV